MDTRPLYLPLTYSDTARAAEIEFNRQRDIEAEGQRAALCSRYEATVPVRGWVIERHIPEPGRRGVYQIMYLARTAEPSGWWSGKRTDALRFTEEEARRTYSALPESLRQTRQVVISLLLR